MHSLLSSWGKTGADLGYLLQGDESPCTSCVEMKALPPPVVYFYSEIKAEGVLEPQIKAGTLSCGCCREDSVCHP